MYSDTLSVASYVKVLLALHSQYIIVKNLLLFTNQTMKEILKELI